VADLVTRRLLRPCAWIAFRIQDNAGVRKLLTELGRGNRARSWAHLLRRSRVFVLGQCLDRGGKGFIEVCSPLPKLGVFRSNFP
jgi:hypothetical protein